MKIKLHFNIWLRSNSMHNTVRLSLVHFYQSQARVIFQLRNNRPVTGLVVKEIFCFKTFSIFNRSCCRPQLNIWILIIDKMKLEVSVCVACLNIACFWKQQPENKKSNADVMLLLLWPRSHSCMSVFSLRIISNRIFSSFTANTKVWTRYYLKNIVSQKFYQTKQTNKQVRYLVRWPVGLKINFLGIYQEQKGQSSPCIVQNPTCLHKIFWVSYT